MFLHVYKDSEKGNSVQHTFLDYVHVQETMFVCVCARASMRLSQREKRKETEGFCVIALSTEACRKKGHVLGSDHTVDYKHNRGGEIERLKGVSEERDKH